ncbi:MAG TPA: hypothetical protein VFY38_15185, partial [Pseudonocardia sp.]|nr:hypothetical protein [Pseudonocardia sp.]
VEQARLLDVVAHGPFPARRSLLRRVSDTRERRHGHRVLEKVLPAGRTTMRYYVSERSGRRRTVVIVGLRRHHRGGG